MISSFTNYQLCEFDTASGNEIKNKFLLQTSVGGAMVRFLAKAALWCDNFPASSLNRS